MSGKSWAPAVAVLTALALALPATSAAAEPLSGVRSADDPAPTRIFAEDYANGLSGWTALAGAVSDWTVTSGTGAAASIDTSAQTSGRYLRPTAALTLPSAYELRTRLKVDSIGSGGTVTVLLDMLDTANFKSKDLAVQLTGFDADGHGRITTAAPFTGATTCSGITPIAAGAWVDLTIRRAAGITAVFAGGQLVAAVNAPTAGGTFGIGSYKSKVSFGAITIDPVTGTASDQPTTASGCNWTPPPVTPPGPRDVHGSASWTAATASTSDRPGTETTAGQSSLSLDGPWAFKTDPAKTGETAGYPQPGSTSGWDSLDVPGNWNVHDAYGRYNGVGWYKRTFQTGDVLATGGERAFLQFDAVYWNASVWLNGTKLGSHTGGYTPFEFDVTGALVDGTNTVVVKADNSFHQGAWWPWGGISREVRIVKTNQLRITNQQIVAMPNLTTGAATVSTTASVTNTGATTATVTVTGAVTADADGSTVQTGALSATVSIPAGATVPVPLSATLAAGSYRLWNLDDPALYRFDLSATAAGAPTFGLSDRFGVRSVTISGTDMLLNGHKIKLAGANRVSDTPVDGNVETTATVRRDLDRMKAAGMNMERIIHVPQSPELLDYADRIGILLIEENPVVWGARNLSSDLPQIQKEYREMVTRDVNHASIFAYSVGNEISGNVTYDRTMAAFSKQLDPTRLVTQASNTTQGTTDSAKDGSYYMDFVSMNTYGNAGADADHVHALYPTKPLFISEYSPDGYTFGIDRETLDNVSGAGSTARAFATRPFVAGWSQWTFNDYRSDFSGSSSDIVRGWGTQDVWGRLKNGYAVVQAANAPISSLQVASVATSSSGALTQVTLTPRGALTADGPSWSLDGYSLVVRGYDATGAVTGGTILPLPQIAPGGTPLTVPVGWAAGAAPVNVRASLLSPQGFELAVADRAVSAAASPTITGTIAFSGGLRVRFTDAAATGSYRVQAVTSSGTVAATVTTSELFADLTGLTNGTAYTVRVQALNGAGSSTAATASATPSGTLAGPPKVVALTPATGALVLGFSDPTPSIVASTAAWFQVGVTDRTTGTETYYSTQNRPGTRVDGLDPSHSYDIRIRRLAGKDQGAVTVWSEALRGAPLGASAAPALDVLGVVAGPQTGGIAVAPSDGTERYLVTVDGPGGHRAMTIERSSVELLPITGLQPQSTYTVTVAAQGAWGTSPAWSGSITTTAASGGAVAAPTALATQDSDTSTVLSWSNGGTAAVDGYFVSRQACGTTTVTAVTGTSLTLGTVGFSGGTYSVVAVSNGVASSSSPSVTVGGSAACSETVPVSSTAARADGSVPFAHSAGWSSSSVTGPDGGPSVYATLTATPNASATWTAAPTDGGRYRIAVGLPNSYSATTASYTVHTTTGDATVTLDQNAQKGAWVELGVFDIPVGEHPTVTIGNGAGSGSSAYLRASSVSFTQVPLGQ